MKLSNETNPVKDLRTSTFLAFVGSMSGCPVLFNHISDMIKSIVHLVNTVWYIGADLTVHDIRQRKIVNHMTTTSKVNTSSYETYNKVYILWWVLSIWPETAFIEREQLSNNESSCAMEK